jgi:hypothetical protein
MRTKTFNNHEFDIRPLKRGEVKKLRKDGLNLAALPVDRADEAMDLVFEIVFDDADLAAIDELDNPHAMELWYAVIEETYGSKAEEGN